MQEANDKTQLKPKKSTQYRDPGLQFFYPPLGLAGIASSFAFFLRANEQQHSNKKVTPDNEIELDKLNLKAR
ncbi:MAG: hypothetical protein M1486_01890 [Gammaproteobacteria bacterium]|nr:hypothetical protein [Gammaproteobacteria bacterium]